MFSRCRSRGGVQIAIAPAHQHPIGFDHQHSRRWNANTLIGCSIAAGTESLIQGLFTAVLADNVATTGDAAVILAP